MDDERQEDAAQPEPEDDSQDDQESPFPAPTMEVIEGHDLSGSEMS
jgi:hypothetical protein